LTRPDLIDKNQQGKEISDDETLIEERENNKKRAAIAFFSILFLVSFRFSFEFLASVERE
jgi:hypothetical protein